MNGDRRRSASSTGLRIRRRFAGSEDTASEARKRIIEKTTGTAQRYLQIGYRSKIWSRRSVHTLPHRGLDIYITASTLAADASCTTRATYTV